MSLQREELGLIGTRFVNFRVSPTRVAVGEPVSIAGTHEEHYVPVLCLWRGWGPSGVDLRVDGTVVASTNTDGEGNFRFAWYLKEVGTYWIKVTYGGDWMHNPCESNEVRVEVITEEQKEEEERRIWLLAAGIGAVILVAIVGLVAWTEYSRRRELMLMAIRRR